MYYLIGLYGQTNHERPRNVLWNSKVSKHSERTDLCLSDDGQVKSLIEGTECIGIGVGIDAGVIIIVYYHHFGAISNDS